MAVTPEQVLAAFRTASGLPVRRVTRTGHDRAAMRHEEAVRIVKAAWGIYP